ncbi:chromosome segregation protein SMC [Cyanobacterium sp. Dongsha4]|uniref:chromosome segregation protein SMC n=1 Tax=Cyanobacterium sp. DS4 TaxID=2878255 RepID=UPI002E8232BF|nr:chromosome segregation protein SMC [Cyanobacterium sp. Dongsha4]WVL02150.1 chromosome segregation protein SMC [Cyanobacterium sp. Dongsha4]
MVHIKQVELSRFKSFGGSNIVPFLTGFTVISGPNGSGKSNILDALLFCLGLASSKGMRAERLPDLINNSQKTNSKSIETVVSVVFDLEDLSSLNNPLLADNDNSKSEEESETKFNLDSQTELKITRRLRVTKGGSYASTFYINDMPCTATELHEQLSRLRIYPEGYNVVLQGDVTRIITMNGKERREIIDELAGVAEFDRKIEQTKTTLEAVREREEKCHIIQEELIQNSARLKQDSEKAAKYQKIKAQIQEKKQWEIVINWRCLLQEKEDYQKQLNDIDIQQTKTQASLVKIQEKIDLTQGELVTLNQQVKALGEDEQISIASQLATEKLKQENLVKRKQELVNLEKEATIKQEEYQRNIKQNQQEISTLSNEIESLENNLIPQLENSKNESKQILDETKKKAQAIASQSQAWVNQQTELNQQINALQGVLNPQLTKQALLTERCSQLQATIQQENQQLAHLEDTIIAKNEEINSLTQQIAVSETSIQNIAEKLAKIEAEIFLNQETLTRLENEQRDKQRQLDKLEATRQAQQEAQGTYASKIILNSDLPGVCGLVAQLGEVESQYQLALEIAAGSRLGFIVVEDDSIASMAIKLLKQQRAGRATFLPLNKINAPRIHLPNNLLKTRGFVDLALNLVDFEPIYQPIFAYVFGNTMVFENLDTARNLIGQHRIVTLDGELLEISGAMTGGSVSQKSSLHFGKVSASESEEFREWRDRISEIENIKPQLTITISQKREKIKSLSEELNQARQNRQKQQLMLEQNQGEISRLEREKENIIESNANNYQQLVTGTQELNSLQEKLPQWQRELEEKQAQLKELESSFDNEEWQQLQQLINEQESVLEEKQLVLSENKEKLRNLVNKQSQLEKELKASEDKMNDLLHNQQRQEEEAVNLHQELEIVSQNIAKFEQQVQGLLEKLQQAKAKRDKQEQELKKIENEQKNLQWKLEKFVLQHQEYQTKISQLNSLIQEVETNLPNPLPEIPFLVNTGLKEGMGQKITFANLKEQLEQIKLEISKLEKKLEALEPVNMLALEQFEKNQERLEELSEKLTTLEGERTELLLRIENFTTLRLRAFKEAFDAVNENFKNIFATLSDGDGYLKLEDENNPFNGGLTLVAHPKGKAVQRLSSMSGGEKSLTALSFIFALQRYRPSPFYAFDEVDMFLDGANVEKLSKMIQRQAKDAQFIVVSLRRPMIEASQRTIGVTQARGAYTQVLGINLN